MRATAASDRLTIRTRVLKGGSSWIRWSFAIAIMSVIYGLLPVPGNSVFSLPIHFTLINYQSFFLSYHLLCLPSLFPILPSIHVGSIHFLSHIIYLSHIFIFIAPLLWKSSYTSSTIFFFHIPNVVATLRKCFMSSFGIEMRECFDPVVQSL